MNIRTSEVFGFPSEAVETVISRVLKTCRAARETRSTYWEDTAAACAVTFSSSWIALWSASSYPETKSSICGPYYQCYARKIARIRDAYRGSNVRPILGHEIGTQFMHCEVGRSICDRGIPHISDGPGHGLLCALDLAQIHREGEDGPDSMRRSGRSGESKETSSRCYGSERGADVVCKNTVTIKDATREAVLVDLPRDAWSLSLHDT